LLQIVSSFAKAVQLALGNKTNLEDLLQKIDNLDAYTDDIRKLIDANKQKYGLDL
jgi:hypothetical protein